VGVAEGLEVVDAVLVLVGVELVVTTVVAPDVEVVPAGEVLVFVPQAVKTRMIATIQTNKM